MRGEIIKLPTDEREMTDSQPTRLRERYGMIRKYVITQINI